MSDKINIYGEWNQYLTQYEILVLGNKGDKVMKYAIPVTFFTKDKLDGIVLKINEALAEYNAIS